MTRTYAAKRLLEHGPLTAHEFIEITGWKTTQAHTTLAALVRTGVAECFNSKGFGFRRYRLCFRWYRVC